VQHARIAALLLPGLGTADDLRAAADAGVAAVRIATHCTEADVSVQHFGVARDLGLDAMGFLMMSHAVAPDALAAQARIMADAGADVVYVVDSAGAMVGTDAADRVRALTAELGDDAEVGFHGHQNLALGVANTVAAHAAGARHVDGTTRGLGAGAGNAPTEVLAAVFSRLGVETGIDLRRILAAAEEVVDPYVARRPQLDRASIVLGYAGVYSSFLLHAEAASARYGVPTDELLQEVGRRGYVGGQEDMIIDVAVRLAGATA
jgi:4-hydroxy 2-oxovalerate aldolase